MIDLSFTDPDSVEFCEGRRTNTIEAHNAAIATIQARINIRNQTLALPTSTGNVMSAAGFGAVSVSQYTKDQLTRANKVDQDLITKYQEVIRKAMADYEVCVRNAQSKEKDCKQQMLDAEATRNTEALKLKLTAMKTRESLMKLLMAQLKLSGAQADLIQKQITGLQNLVNSLNNQADVMQKRQVFVDDCSDPMSLKPDSFTYP